MAKDTEEINMDEFLNLDLAADNESSGSDHIDELAEDVKLANQEKSKPLAQAPPPLKEEDPPAFAVEKSNAPMNVDKPTKVKNNNEEEEESANKQDDDDDLVYEVEAIVDHRLKKSKLEYLIKWKGYPHEENTWEDQDNLFCNGLIGEYWDQKERLAEQEKDRTLRLLTTTRKKSSSPGQWKSSAKERVRKASSPDSVNNDTRSMYDDTRENGGSKKRSRSDDGERKSTKGPSHIAKRRNVSESDDNEQQELQSAAREQSTTASPSAQAADDDNFVPAEISGSWEPHIEEVQTVQMSEDGQLMVYLNWKNGHVTMHSAKLANAKCPQKVIQFYEKRLQFSSSKKKD